MFLQQILVSEMLLKQCHIPEQFAVEELGEPLLCGKEQTITLYSVQPRT